MRDEFSAQPRTFHWRNRAWAWNAHTAQKTFTLEDLTSHCQSHCWTWKRTSLNLCFRDRVFHMCFCLQVLILHNAKQTWGLFLLFPLPSSLSYLSHNSVRKPKANQKRHRSLCRMTSTTQHYRRGEKNKQECWNQTGCWKQLQMVSHKRSYSFLFYHGAQIIKN